MTSKDAHSKKDSRLERLQNALKKEDLDVCLVEHPLDLFYLTGLTLSKGHLFVGQKKTHLFVDGRYLEIAKSLKEVDCSLSSEENILSFLMESKARSLGFEPQETSYERYSALQSLLKKAKKKSEGLGALVPCSIVKNLRMIKDKKEQELLRKSAALNWMSYEFLLTILAPNMTERQAAREWEIFCLTKDAEKPAFEPIVAFGKNTSMPHYRSGHAKLKKGDIVLLDLGVELSHYTSDMTRMYFFGKPDPQLEKMYEVIREAHAAALEICKPGVQVGELDKAARAIMSKAGLEKYFIHSLGHGIGLEVHEAPRIKAGGEDAHTILESGMAITIEPGLYIPNLGGVRFEDTILITEKGYENFYAPESKK
jgi:Xaa-Pro aminopeptidase